MDNTIYVQWSDDGQHIRKWSRGPFEGAELFSRISALTSDGGREALRRDYDDVSIDYALRSALRFAASRSAITAKDEQAILAAFAQPVEAGEDGLREAMRQQGQREGKAAVCQWLRERGAMRPPAVLHHAAGILAGQFEQSEIPGANQ